MSLGKQWVQWSLFSAVATIMDNSIRFWGCHSFITIGTLLYPYILSFFPVWWPGNKNSPTVTHACRKRRLKWVPGAWGITGPPLPLGDINTEAWSSRLGWGVGLTTLPCKKENCWDASKKKKRRPKPKLGCGAKERDILSFTKFIKYQNKGKGKVVPML
jgi:hypothetical protein